MFTRCPHCQTVYRVIPPQLSAADGRVRCGHCGTVFDAGDTLSDDLETLAPDATDPGMAPADEAPDSTSATAAQAPSAADASEPAPADLSDEDTTAATVPPAASAGDAATQPPRAIEDDLQTLLAPPSRGRLLRWTALIALLALLLAGQYAWFMRDQLAQSPQLRPWVERMCAQFGCHLALKKDLKQLRLLSRDVVVSPKNHGVLLVSATLVNTAPFTQAYPTLEITLSNERGERTAMRRFRPQEYLPSGTDVDAGMPSDTPVDIRLELVNPEGKVASYQFAFR